MRLIGLLCVTLLLAALATLAYEQREIYLPDIAALASSDRVIEHDQRWDRSENHTPLQGTIVSVPYSSPESWIGLSGFESYGRAEFPLPSTADVGAGEVVLNLTSDLEHGAVARLRLNVNGTRRSEIVLQGGVKRHQVLFPLRDEDLLADRVVVTMAIEGAAPRIVCQRHWDSGVVVRLHPTSHLSLSVDAPLVAPLDLMRASGLPAQVIWPTDAGTDQKDALLSLAGVYGPITFVSEADSPSEALTIPESDARQLVEGYDPLPSKIDSWPVGLDQLAVNTLSRPLLRVNNWRINFDRRELPGQGKLTSVDFGLRIASLVAQDWLLTVTLNDRLVHSETISGTAIDLKREVPLDQMGEGFKGNVDFNLSRPAEGHDNCRDLPPAMGHLTELSVLDGTPDADYYGGLYAGTAGRFTLKSTANLSARDATIGIATVRAVFPAHYLKFEGTGPAPAGTMTILSGDDTASRLQTLMDAAPTARHWLIWLSADENGAQTPQIMQVKDGGGSDSPANLRTSVLVTLP